MRTALGSVLASLTLTALLANFAAAQNPVSSQTIANYLHVPLAFERRDAGVNETWVAHGQGYAISLSRGKAAIQASSKTSEKPQAFSLEFSGAKSPAAVPGAQLPGKVNYIYGNDPKNWRIGLSTYDRVTYPGLYPGVDLVYYGNQQAIEFDLDLKPGADPRAIRLKVGGGAKLTIDDSGDLRIGGGDVRIALPKIYQEINGAKKAIPGHYALRGKDEVGFEMAAWDRTRPLVIDPTIIGPGMVFSALLGGSTSTTFGEKIALDSSGNIYLTGLTSAADFPLSNPQQSGTIGIPDGFVAKANTTGQFVYSTYFGGSGADEFFGIAADGNGNAWVTGFTNSSDFPLMNATQSVYGGATDAVVVKLTSSGALAFSTYLGGSSLDEGLGIAVDGSNNAYVTGYTNGSFSTTPGVIQSAFQGGSDIFVTKYSSAGSVLYSTLLGGSGMDQGTGIAVDSSGNAYVTGETNSSAFVPANPSGGAQAVYAGSTDAFVAKLNPTATALVYFTYLGGGAFEEGEGIAIDGNGNAYVGGYTTSTGIATQGAAQTLFGGSEDGFAAKLNSTGTTFNYVTYLGGNRNDQVLGVAVDGGGNAYVTGFTDSTNLPTVNPLQAASSGNTTSLLQTTNSGTAWSSIDGNTPGAVFDISPDPVTSGTIVIATEQGIYRTTNGGTSWTQQLPNTVGSASLSRSPVTSSTIYYTQGNGNTRVSTDNGVTWTAQGVLSINPAAGIVADGVSAQTAYVFGSNGIYVTTNGGKSWTAATTGLPSTNVASMAAGKDGSLYAAVQSSGLYKSTNQGASWTSINGGGLPSPSFSNTHGIVVSPSFVLFSTDGQVYYSLDSGTSWSGAGLPGGSASAVTASADSSVIYAASTTGNVYSILTSGNADWMPAGMSLTTSSIRSLYVDPLNNARVFAVVAVPNAAIVAKINSTGSAFLYSTYLGGFGNTEGEGIATNGNGQAYVTGYTEGTGFPLASVHSLATSQTDAFGAVIVDTASSCTYTVNPTTFTVTGVAQTAIISIAAPNGCSWTAASNQSWAPVTPTSSSGSGVVIAQIAENDTGSTRTATLTIGGQNIAVTESDSSCTYNLDQGIYFVGAAGGTITANLTTGAGCAWAVRNVAPSAVTINSGASGTGSGAISITVAASSDGNQRSLVLPVGYLSIDASISITQTGTCVYTPATTSANVPAAGQSNSVSFTASAGYCSTFPVLLSNAGWLTASGSNLGLKYTAAPNTGAARTGTITIGSGGTVTVNQAASAPPQVGAITGFGVTVNNLDAIAFNSSGTLYGGTSGTGSLYTINPANGAVTLIHALVGASNASLTYGVYGLAFQPGTGTLYGATSSDSLNAANNLVTINPATGQVTVIGPIGSGPCTDISFAPNGTLYAWLVGSGGTTASVATLNLTTGAGTSLGSPQNNVADQWAGLAVNSSGVIYVAANGHVAAPCGAVNCNGAFWTINPSTGAPTTIGTLNGGPGSAPTITALAFSPSGVLYGIEGGFGGASWDLITINVVPPTPAFFTGENSLGSGVYYLQFPDGNLFGYYNFPSSSILYHYDLGFEAFVPGTGTADIYLYDFTSSHWWYTSASLFPYLYDFTLNNWIFYFTDTKNAGHYTTNPRYFSNLTTGKIFTM